MHASNFSTTATEWDKFESYYNFDKAPGQLIFAVAVYLVLLLIILCKPRL